MKIVIRKQPLHMCEQSMGDDGQISIRHAWYFRGVPPEYFHQGKTGVRIDWVLGWWLKVVFRWWRRVVACSECSTRKHRQQTGDGGALSVRCGGTY
jgi:hypothetical protein